MEQPPRTVGETRTGAGRRGAPEGKLEVGRTETGAKWARPRGLVLALAVAVVPALAAAMPYGSAAPGLQGARPALEGNRKPHQLAFSPDGSRLYVTEEAEDTIAVVDPAVRRVVGRFPSGGERPAGLAVSPDGRELAVANSYSGRLALLDAATGASRATVPLPGLPWGVVLSPDGLLAYVSLSQLDEVAVVDLPRARVAARIPVGRRPRALALSPDGRLLVVANQSGGSLSLVSTASLREERRAPLRGVNVRGVAVTADGEEAYATLMPPFNARLTDNTREIWHNIVQSASLISPTAAGEDQWTDFARLPGSVEVVGSPDQEAIVLDGADRHAWLAVSGRDVVTRITIRDRRRIAIWPFSQAEVRVGATPRALALRPLPGSSPGPPRELWVANYLGNNLSVVDARDPRLLATVELGPATRPDPGTLGEYLFRNAALTRLHRFSCNSCHPDGAADGLTWRFAHVPDGLDRRNTRDLRGGVAGTAPFRWSGHDPHLGEFVEAEVTGLLGGPKPAAEQTRALEAFLATLRLPPNPNRRAEGTLTAEAERGRQLFLGRAGCAGCHAGPRAGGAGVKAWVGTTPPSLPLDVPHLEGAYDSAPYLHDGSAATLEEVFTARNAGQWHGGAHLLAPDELAAVLRYVREL